MKLKIIKFFYGLLACCLVFGFQSACCAVLCIGADIIEEELLEQKVKLWLETPFEGGRHARRVDKIMNAENGKEF